MKNLDFEPTYCVVNDSGGKDSTAITLLMASALSEVCPVKVHHQYLPEEWEGTVEYVQNTCNRLGLELIVDQAFYYGFECFICDNRWLSSHKKITCPRCKETTGRQIAAIQGLVDLMEWRKMWPGMGSIRWCTSYLKRDLFDKWARVHKEELGARPITVLGERWLESRNRAKLPWSKPRHTLTWLTEYRPILDWRRIDVFRYLRDRGIEPHPAYKLQGMTDHDMYEVDVEGGPRCSCVCCIYLTPQNVAKNLAMPRHHKLAGRLVSFEDRTNHTFKQNLGIRDAFETFEPGIIINRLHNEKIEIRCA
jgi:3'-phosphoadenosine 5'-phosphosulfate sulfotransferase (PAPS reductase)/FAD synthetase